MIDQATELRKLVLQSVRQQAALSGPAPRLIVLASGKEQVGVTTLALNLSVALAEYGCRVVTVDGSGSGYDVSELCGLPPLPSGESPSPHRDIHEVLQRGPAGIQIVPGLGSQTQHEWSETAQNRLLRQFRALGRHADIVVLDAGSQPHPFLRRCLQEANDALMVTTSDPQSVMDTYARIKIAVDQENNAKVQLVVNQVRDVSLAEDVHARLEMSSQRFLDRDLPLAAVIPHDTRLSPDGPATTPVVLARPTAPVSRALVELASQLLGQDPGSQRTSKRAA